MPFIPFRAAGRKGILFSVGAMMVKVYLETSVISYLTARPSRDVVKLAKQELTRQWWEESRSAYVCCVSDPVIAEIRRGDALAAQKRLDMVAGLTVLDISRAALDLYDRLLSSRILPGKAALDGFHIAIAAAHGIPYLATWNCTHINNAVLKKKIGEEVLKAGYNEVTIATPEELRK